jgi:hypothetical protein
MKKIKTLSILALILLLVGCGNVLNENDPVSIARSFWDSALSSTPDDAKKFMKNGQALAVTIKGHHEADTAILGDVTQEDGYYFIDTRVQLLRAGIYVVIPMRTVVVPVNGLWKVDYWSTKQSVFDATFDKSIQWFSSTLDSAEIYVGDILGAGDKEEAFEFAEKRLNEDFTRVQKIILQQYKARLEHGQPTAKP